MRANGWVDLSLRDWARRVKLDGATLWFALRDPRTPWWTRWLIAFVVGYAFSPIDLIPDFIPVLGYLDDVVLLPGLIYLAIRLLPLQVKQECREQAQTWLDTGAAKPKLYWSIVVITVMWLLMALALYYATSI